MNSKKILTITLITLLIIGLLWTTKPWQKLEGEENSSKNQEENVLFAYQATFTYENSTHQQPLDNLILSFPAPNIDNKISSNQLPIRGWELFFIDNENQIWPETSYDAINDNKTTHKLKGNRTKELEILQGPGLNNTTRIPTLQYQLSELYPGEQFNIYYYVRVENKNANNLTLKQAGENQRSNANFNWPQGDAENKTIDLYFDARLARQVSSEYGVNQYQTVERFIRHYKNGGSSWYWLYPA